MNFVGRSPLSEPVDRAEREHRNCALLVPSLLHVHRSAVWALSQLEASIIAQITHAKYLHSLLHSEDRKGRELHYREPPQSPVSAHTSSSFLPPQSRKLSYQRMLCVGAVEAFLRFAGVKSALRAWHGCVCLDESFSLSQQTLSGVFACQHLKPKVFGFLCACVCVWCAASTLIIQV